MLETEQDLDWMLRWSRNAFVMMSMMNYPYASYHLPANPVNVSCNKAIEFGIQNPLAGLREAIGVFYDRSPGRQNAYFSFAAALNGGRVFIDAPNLLGFTRVSEYTPN